MRLPSRSDALYLSPLVFTFIYTLLNPNQSFLPDILIHVIGVLTVTNFPGFYITLIVKHEFELDQDEFLVLNPVINTILVLFSYIFLTFLPFKITRLVISSVLTVLCAISFVFFETRTRPMRGSELVKFRVGEIIGFFWSSISGAIMILKVLPAEYWYGNDTWEAAAIINNLPRLSLNPWEAFDYYYSYLTLSHFGFYYYTSVFHLLTGISTDVILRFGPLIFAGLCSSLVYIIVKRMEGSIIGVFASIVLFINPKMNERFSMLLRENFAFILFLAMLFLLSIHSKHDSKNIILPAVIGLLLAGIVISHPMTAILGAYIIVMYLAHHNMDGDKTRVFEVIISIAILALIILPFFSLVGFTYFIVLKNTTQILQSTSIIITFFLISVIWFKRISPHLRQKSNPIHRFIFVLITLIAFSQVFLFPRNFSGNPIYDDLSMDMFSGTLNILSVAGLLLSIVLPYDHLIYNLSYFLIFLLGASSLGLRVPLQRLAIYITLIQVYYASGVFNRLKIFTPTIREGVFSLQIPNLIKKINFNSMIFILIVLLSPILIVETANLTPPSEVTYTKGDIQSLERFLSTVEHEDLILPHKRVLWALHYLNVSRDIIASTLDQKNWVVNSYNSTDVNATLDSLPEAWMNKKRLHVVSLSSYFYNEEFRDTLPFKDILEKSVEKKILNTTIVYTFNIPYRVRDIPVRNINTIMRDPRKVPYSEPTEYFGKDVKNPSNIVSFELNGDLVSLLCYVERNSDTSERVHLSTISLNSSWEIIGPITAGGYDNPYLVKDDETLYLFCERIVDSNIVRFSSIDGCNWVNETAVLPKSPELKYQIMESPVVLKEGDVWRMVYTETASGDTNNIQELVYLESIDGEVWQRNEDYFNWDFFIDNLEEKPVEKVLLDDVMRLPDGYLFLGKYYMKKGWFTQEIGTGSFYISTLDSRSAEITPYVYLDLPLKGRRIDSVHFLFDEFNSFRGFFYIDNEEYKVEGTENTIYMGIPN